jgi:hypothetical protein
MITPLLAAIALAGAAAAQDTPSIDFTGALDHARTTGRLVRQAQQRQAGIAPRRATAAQAKACANKQAFRRQYGVGHAKVQRLYALCRAVGL